MSDYFERVERQIVERMDAGRARSPRLSVLPGQVAMAAAVVVVIAVAGVFLLARGSGAGSPPAAAPNSLRLLITAAPAHPPAAILDDTVRILQERLQAVFPGVNVTRAGQRVVVDVRNPPAAARSEILALLVPGRLAFYDWEADVLAPNGKTVASQLPAGNPAALKISQGSGSGAPGEPGAGGVDLRQAVRELPRPSTGGRFAFVQAVDRDPRHPVEPGGLNARFYVLRGVPALTGADLTHPQAGADPNTGRPDVTFEFTVAGERAFKKLTAALARRGSRISSLGLALNQHFAIVLDEQLITVPQIDFKVYPDGISGDQRADITGSLTLQSARNLAILLRYGPLPVSLRATG